MKNKLFIALIILSSTAFTSCSQDSKTNEVNDLEVTNNKEESVKTEPHKYGGWYCPDNLGGFAAVDIANWESVPVINGRLPTKEETHNGSSLIFVDSEKYPKAKILAMQMPRLAKFYNRHSRKQELIIVIQALNVDNDSVVGFRYLNGGNGSARLNEVTFLSDDEIALIPSTQFVTTDIEINATQKEIWEILTDPKYSKTLQSIFDKNNILKTDWMDVSNVNYHYANGGSLTSMYGDVLYGNYYIQNDYEDFTEKFLLLEDNESHSTELQIVCGPYGDDFETQKAILEKWALKVKELSEKE